MAKKLWSLLALLNLTAFSHVTLGTPILDQSYEGDGVRSFVYEADGGVLVKKAQTFTVGTTGILTGLELEISHGIDVFADLLWDIRIASSDSPSVPDIGPNILASGSVYAASVGVNFEWVSLADDLLIGVESGDILAITLRSFTGGGFGLSEIWEWHGGVQEPYENGAAFFSSGDIWIEDAYDLNFRTYVEACTPGEPGCGAIPIPASTTLLGIGLLALSFARRNSTRTSA